MSIFDDVINVVKNIVENTVPVIAGGAVLGPVGTVAGAVIANEEVKAANATAEALEVYRQHYDQAIVDLKNAPPDYAELEKIWAQFFTESSLAAYKLRYKTALPPLEYIAPMIAQDLIDYRATFTDDGFKTQLDNIHKGSVEAGVQQLQHERNNPEKSGQPNTSEVLNQFFTDYINAVGRWMGERFASNFEGAQNEPGVGAKILRAGVGISWEDIKARGLLGGDNSYLRKIVPTWSDNGGLFGGENSFFRKPFG